MVEAFHNWHMYILVTCVGLFYSVTIWLDAIELYHSNKFAEWPSTTKYTLGLAVGLTAIFLVATIALYSY